MIREGYNLDENPYDRDDLTIREIDPLLQKKYAGESTPSEKFYEELAKQHGSRHVDYTNRCFYIRVYKKTMGRYPSRLDYTRTKCLLAIEEEVNLKQAYEMYKLRQEQEQQMAKAKSQSGTRNLSRGMGGGGTGGGRRTF